MMAMWLVLVNVKEWVVLGVVVNFGVSDCVDDEVGVGIYFATIIAF